MSFPRRQALNSTTGFDFSPPLIPINTLKSRSCVHRQHNARAETAEGGSGARCMLASDCRWMGWRTSGLTGIHSWFSRSSGPSFRPWASSFYPNSLLDRFSVESNSRMQALVHRLAVFLLSQTVQPLAKSRLTAPSPIPSLRYGLSIVPLT